MPFTIFHLFALITFILALVPLIILLWQYQRTGINEYILLAAFFLIGALDQVVFILTGFGEKLIYYQLHWFLFTLTFFLIFIHATRIIWQKPPILLMMIGYGWFLIITILIIGWKLETQTDQMKIGFITLNYFESGYHPKGAGISINGFIINSTAFPYLSLSYSVFSATIILYVHLRITPVNPTPKIKKIRKLWISAWFLLLVFTVSQLATNTVNIVSEIALVLGLVLVFYIAAVMPEALLISHVQLLRAYKLYEQVKSQDISKLGSEIRSKTLIEYLNSTLDLKNELEG